MAVEGRQTQLTDKREGQRLDLMRTARVQRHESSVLHNRFPLSIRLYSSTITIETKELQQRNWECEAGFHEHTSVSLHLPLPNNARGGDTRVHEATAQSRHCQRASEPSAVDMPHDVGVLTRPLFQVVPCLCLAQRATWSRQHHDRDRVLHDAKGTIREAYSRFIEK